MTSSTLPITGEEDPAIEETAGHVGPRSGLKRMERKTVQRDLVYMKRGVRNNDDNYFIEPRIFLT